MSMLKAYLWLLDLLVACGLFGSDLFLWVLRRASACSEWDELPATCPCGAAAINGLTYCEQCWPF